MRNIVLFTLLGSAALGCHDGATPVDVSAVSEASEDAHFDLRTERASLIAAGNALSDAIASQGLIAAIGGALEQDALVLVPRAAVLEGRTAALSFLSTDPTAPSVLKWKVIVADVSNDGTQGFTWGEGSLTVDLGAGPAERPALFLIYWRRAASDWNIAALSINVGGPLSSPVPQAFGTPTTKHRRNFPNTEVNQQRSQLLSVDADFSAASVSSGLGPAFASFAAPDAIAVGGGEFVFGPDDIGEAFTTEPNDVVSWVPRFSDVAASGDLGFTVGDAIFVFAASGTFYTKYLTVWQKQNTGEWKFRADFGSSRPAP
jgi:ketosteroid isomerase-like protein